MAPWNQGGKPGSEGQAAPSYIVTSESQSNEIGIQTLVGDYADKGANHGKRYYQKVQAIKGHEDIKVFLYYWDERDGDDFSGWWFGDSVGGTEVWARCDDKGPLPPRVGWRVPWDSPTATPGLLFVDSAKASGTSSGSAASPAVNSKGAAKGAAKGAGKPAGAQVDAVDQAAQAVITRTKAALSAQKPRAEAYMKDLETKLKQQQAALGAAGSGDTLATIEELLEKVQAQLGKSPAPQVQPTKPAAPQVQQTKPAAPQAPVKAEVDKSREEKDTKDLDECLPIAREAALAAEETIEALVALADPIVAFPPPDDSDDLKNALDEVEAMVQDAQARITDARKVVASKLTSARTYVPEVRKVALAEYSALQTNLGEAQKKLMPYKSFKKDFKSKVVAKQALIEFTEKLGTAELEVEKAEMMSLVSDGEQKPEEEIAATEKAIEPAVSEIAGLLRSIEQKLRSADAALKDELLQVKEKAVALQKKCDAVKKEMRSQRMGLSAKEMASKVSEKVIAVEDALAACHAAEMPFLKGIEVLPGDESEKAISSCEAAATKAEAALNHAKILIKAKHVEAQKLPKELQDKAKADLAEFQKRTDEFSKKVQDFRKETTDRKIESIMSEVVVAIVAAEEKTKAHTEVAKVFSDDLEKVSIEALQEAMDKITDFDKEAASALVEARKQIAARQKDARTGPAAASLKKLQERVSDCQAELAKHRKAAQSGEKLIKGKDIITEERKNIEAMESEVAKAVKAVVPLEVGGELTDDEMAEVGGAMVGAQNAVKQTAKSLETHMALAAPSLKSALQKLLERCKAGQEKLDKTFDGSKSKKEEVLGFAYLMDARKKAELVELCEAKVGDVELPFMKGVEVLPAEEAVPAVAASEKAAEDLSSSISEARNYMAAKNLELKSFGDKEKSKSLTQEFAQLSARVNAAATKLSTFKKETEKRKKTAQLQEATEKVTALEGDVSKIAELVAPLTGEDAASLAAEESDSICEAAANQSKAAQAAIEECRSLLLARKKDALPKSEETIKELSTRLAALSSSLTKTKKSFQEQEHKFLGKRLVKEAEELIAGLGAEVTAAEEACAKLLVQGGEEFLVATSLRTLASALQDYMSKESKDVATVFKEAGSGEANISQEVFVAYLQQLPDTIAHPEVEFTEERRTAIFKLLDSDSSGTVDENKFKSMFKLQFLCVQAVSMTDSLQVSSSKTICKVEQDTILEALGAVSKDEKGVERVEAKIVSSGQSGFVTIKGNQGSLYFKTIHPFDEFCKEMDKALDDRVQNVKKATASLNSKTSELQAAGKSECLVQARAELAKLRPKAIGHLTELQALQKKVRNAKEEFSKTETAEKNAHIEAKERREAEAITNEVTEELAAAELLAKQIEETADSLVSLKAEELQSFASPATVQETVAKLVPEAVEALSKVKEAAQEKQKTLAKALKGPMLEAKKNIIKMITSVDAATKKCNAKLGAVNTCCKGIAEDTLMRASSALRDMLRSSGSTTDEVFRELAKGEDRIGEDMFCSKISSLPGLSIQPEAVKLLYRHIEDGGVSKRSFISLAQKYYRVTTSIAITPDFDVGKGKMLRKAESDELIEVLEGPQTDEKTSLSRVKGRALLDNIEGWISIKGNQGSVFLKEVEKPFYTVTSDKEIRLDSECKASGDAVRLLKPGEILEMLSGPQKEAFEPSIWARGKVTSGDATGWFNIRARDSTVYAETDSKLYTCSATIALTDELDIKKCEVLKKLAIGDVIIVEEGPVEVPESGVTRLKGRTSGDDKVGWITVKGSAGTVYVEPSKKHYTIVKGVTLRKAMDSSSESVKELAVGDVMKILEGPKEETFEPVRRVEVKASSDGATGWVTVGPASVTRWTGMYKCSTPEPLHSACKEEGAEVLRDLTAGELLEHQEGPVEEGSELRVKVKAKKDGVIGWATLIDGKGKRILT
eukprot:TRINITY_DN4359_c0_g3_i1.p1 TRINITY_DN4359_c0_g3~~TRINITY_DN4359_c0_g3_i1.p1  ORF type:complete len:1928 (+),score=567.13 TRINITY_DN4359_c0_g3_i1:69-5852(+)